MSLDTALSISTRALSLAQDGITTSSNNIANINTPGYIKQSTIQSSVVVNGIGDGAEITGLSANVDKELLSSINLQLGTLGSATTTNSYYTTIQNLYGQPNANNSLSTKIDAFFNSYQNLSNNPETPSLRVAAASATTDLTTTISTIANGLQKVRYDADQEISTDVTAINSTLADLQKDNSDILNYTENTSGYVNIKQKMNVSLQTLSQYMNLSISYNEHGQVAIATGNGISLLDTATNTKLQYTPAPSTGTFSNDQVLNALQVVGYDTKGVPNNTVQNLVTGGKSSDVTTSLTSGSLLSLVNIRDSVAPKLLDQMDTLASGLVNQVNAVQNNGYGFPPPSTLSGTTPVTSNQQVGFTGKVMIAVLNPDGTPVNSPYTGEDSLRPLTIDLGAIDSGDGAGKPTVQDIVNQINDYYGPVQNLAQVGNVRNVQLEAVSSSIGDNTGTAKFDLKLDNTSLNDSTVKVLGVTLTDPNDPTAVYGGATAIPSPNSFTIKAGDMGSTGQPFTVDFSGGNNISNYNMTVKVQVTDSKGNVSVADVTYNVADNVTNNKNAVYSATGMANNTDPSKFVQAPNGSTFASASIVNADGTPVNPGDPGFLKITTSNGYSIAINEMDSKEVGIPGNTTPATNEGFSQYFGLNNLLVDTGKTKNAAMNLSVRSDILKNPNLISAGQLVLSNQPNDGINAVYTYEAGIGNNSASNAMAALGNQNVFFKASGDLPSVNITFSAYSGDIIGAVASSSSNATTAQTSQQTGLDGLETLFQKSAGVSSDDELAKIIALQNNFTASAKVISIVQQMYTALTEALR